MIACGPKPMRNRQQLPSNLLSKVTVYYLLAKDLVGLLLDGLRVVLGVHREVVVEQVEQYSVVLFFTGVVGQKS